MMRMYKPITNKDTVHCYCNYCDYFKCYNNSSNGITNHSRFYNHHIGYCSKTHLSTFMHSQTYYCKYYKETIHNAFGIESKDYIDDIRILNQIKKQTFPKL